ncbi:hypothetical protein CHUAL_011417 [Chamberlinius hualienensis]
MLKISIVILSLYLLLCAVKSYSINDFPDLNPPVQRHNKRTVFSFLDVLLNPSEYLSTHTPVEWRTDKIIENYGYSCETHRVETNDGYILEMQRIITNTSNTKKFPVLMQHGILVYGPFFIETIPNKTLSYMLVDAGFDVWIGNLRGSPHGRKHKTLNPNSEQFWNFSFEELGMYDLSAMVDYIILTTNKPKIYYISHSMGTTLGFTLLSMKPEYNDKFEAFIALAPVAYVHHVNGNFLNLLMKLTTTISGVLRLMGIYEFPPLFMEMKVLSICENMWSICVPILKDMNGGSNRNFSKQTLINVFNHYGAPTSLRTYEHYSQIATSKKFQRYDKGLVSNILFYGQSQPPEYRLETITTPTIFYCGEDDHLSNLEDVHLLAQRLPKHLETYIVNDQSFSHMDFVYAEDVDIKVNINVLQMIEFLDKIAGFNIIKDVKLNIK